MTREDIIKMAREVGFTVDDIFGVPYALLNEMTFYNFNDALVRFANLVATAERDVLRLEMTDLRRFAEQMKPLDRDIAAILHTNLDSLYVEDPPTLTAPDETKALRRDAERYRWLTEDHPKQETRGQVYSTTLLFNVRRKEHIDAAIDAAMGDQL